MINFSHCQAFKHGLSSVWPRMGLLLAVLFFFSFQAEAARQEEVLDRGVVASRASGSSNKALVSWRFLRTDPIDLAFNVYRASGGGAAVKLNSEPITRTTNFMDATVDFSASNVYTVKSVLKGVESDEKGSFTLSAQPIVNYFTIPVNYITSPDESYTYSLSDCTVGDLDGDGAYEIVVKWDPSNAKDNSHEGVTGVVYIDAYKLDGTQLWRVNLGPNIRAGAHYTQMMVADFDGDGKAELAVRTSELTTFGDGTQIGDVDNDGVTNYVDSNGFIDAGPEFLSVIDGMTGKEMARSDYIERGPESEWYAEWGDNWNNRMDRFLGGVGYFDGERPSILICRGYYKKSVLEAWDYRNGQLVKRWNFTADSKQNSSYRGQGNHNLVVGDVDGDGKDEVTYGSCAIDDDGSPLYNTNYGHGDAMHLSDMDPLRPGLEVWQCHEDGSSPVGSEFRDAATGETIFGIYAGSDVGRSMAADIDPNHVGYEMWTTATGVLNTKGETINTSRPSVNFGVFWVGGLNRELLDGTAVNNYLTGRVLTASGSSCNGTKATPNLSADILGDWREEIILHSGDSKQLIVHVSPVQTSYRFITLMQDHLYRNMVATQNIGYNQPPHLGYYLGSDLGKMIQDRDIITRLSSYTVDAGYDYDSVRWSNGTTGRVTTIEASNYDIKTKYTADIYFNGSWFRDSLYVTFKAPVKESYIWVGDENSNVWNTTSSLWLYQGQQVPYVTGEPVTFDYRGSSHPVITLNESMQTGQVYFNADSDYEINGTGGIAGESVSLSKTGTGTVKMNVNHTYQGTTDLVSGTMEVASLPNGGEAGPFGAAPAEASYLLFNGGKLKYTGSSASTDKGMTFNPPRAQDDVEGLDATSGSGTLDIPSAGNSLTLTGLLTGDGTLVKEGEGTLVLSHANNTYSGTHIKAGTVYIDNYDYFSTALGSDTVTLDGGRLSFLNNGTSSYGAFSNPIFVPLGSKGYVDLFGQGTLSSSALGGFGGNVSGGGDLYITIPVKMSYGGYMKWRGGVGFTGNWTNFSGNAYILGGTSGGSMGIRGYYFARTSLHLGENVDIFWSNTSGKQSSAIQIGALSGETGSAVYGGPTGSNDRATSYQIGALNTDAVFQGSIRTFSLDTWSQQPLLRIEKIGTGIWTLSGNSEYYGAEDYALQLSAGTILVNGSFKVMNTSPVIVAANAIIGGSGTLSAIVTQNGILQPGNQGVGALTFTDDVTMGSAASLQVQIDKAQSVNDKIVLADTASMQLGGTLSITLMDGSYALGDAFTLFSGGARTGSFSSISPAVPAAGLIWDTSELATTGVLKIAADPVPVIVSQPHFEGSICQGETASLSVAATAPGGITQYQWYMGSTGLGGANGSTYEASVSGTYHVRVYSGSHYVQSESVSVAVKATPTITQQPASTAISGESATALLQVKASSATAYQWYMNGEVIADATQSTYQASQTGTYHVMVYNGTCSTQSTSAMVNDDPSPKITQQPAFEGTLCRDETATLSVQAIAPNGITGYQWYNGSSMISGATSASYVVSTTGNYSVKVYSDTYATTSQTVYVEVKPYPNISDQSWGVPLCAGGSALLYVNASNVESYQWYKDHVIMEGQTGSTYTATEAGRYNVLVSNGKCVTESSIMTVNEISAPTVSVDASDASVCEGQSIPLTATVQSDVTYTLQWYRSGNRITGATASTYTTGTTSSASGQYTVQATNQCGTTSSAPLTVSIHDLPTVTLSAQSNLLTATASNDVASYAWYNPALISSAAHATYRALSSGTYRVVVTNGYGCVAESQYVLTGVTASPEDDLLSGLSVYPNPTSGPLTVMVPSTSDEVLISVESATGALLYESKFKSGTYTLNLSAYPDGIYFVKVISGEKMVIKKVMKGL